jgi:hypothetical protein
VGILKEYLSWNGGDPNQSRRPSGQEDYRQCNNGNVGTFYALTGHYTPSIRLTTDYRWGGCDWALAFIDTAGKYQGLRLAVDWGGNSAECANAGRHEIPVTYNKVVWSPVINLDMDGRPGQCFLEFHVLSDSVAYEFEWRVKFADNNDKLICQPISLVGKKGKPARIGLNVHDGHSCDLSVALIANPKKQ